MKQKSDQKEAREKEALTFHSLPNSLQQLQFCLECLLQNKNTGSGGSHSIGTVI